MPARWLGATAINIPYTIHYSIEHSIDSKEYIVYMVGSVRVCKPACGGQ